jgi:hypothetical protein
MRSSEPGLARKVETKRAWLEERREGCGLFEVKETNFGDLGRRGRLGGAADRRLMIREQG